MGSRAGLWWWVRVCIWALGVCMAAPAVAAAATRYVTTGGSDFNPCTQASPCASVSHAVSIAAANDTIEVGPGSFTDHVTIPAAVSPLTIQGAGMSQTAVSGGVVTPGSVFTIPSATTVTIEDLAIIDGQADNGGGVNSNGQLTMRRDEVAFNSATGTTSGTGRGGGIYDTGPQDDVSDTAIVHNTATQAGGGIWSGGTVERDLIYSNQVTGSSGRGGGVLSSLGNVVNDTIVGNKVQDLMGNRQGAGGGVGTVASTLLTDTITGNSAAEGGGVDPGSIGARFGNTILSANQPDNCTPSRFRPGDTGGNLEDDPGDICGFSSSDGDIVGQDPKLGALAVNGGPTKTMALLPGSPAIGAADHCGFAPVGDIDQRGFPRRTASRLACDIGAWDSGGVHATAHQLIVSELRLGAPSGVNDGYVDLYNASGSSLPVLGWWLGYEDASGTLHPISLPDTTIPARGHVLIAPGAPNFSLWSYATPDIVQPLDLSTATGTGIKVEAQDNTITDQAGPATSDLHAGTPLPNASLSGWDVAFVRRYSAGVPVDTDDNASDFALVATDAATNGHGAGAVLGAPGPMALASPSQQNAIAQSNLFDGSAAASAAPNRVYDAGTGTLTVRRRITNTSATQTITGLRLRFTSITTYGNTTPSQAILTIRSSSPDETVGGKSVEGLILDQPPGQGFSGGGLNSSLTVPLPSGGLAPGQSVNVNIVFHAVRGGSFSFGYNAEATTS